MKILLFKSNNLNILSWIISALTRGIYCHSAILVNEKHHEIVEAFYPHVRKRILLESELPTIDVYSAPSLTPSEEKIILDYCYTAVAIQTPYSILNLFRFLAPFRTFIGEGWDNSIESPTICSQFIMRAFNQVRPLLRARPEDVDPENLSWVVDLVKDAPLKPIKYNTV